MKQNIKITCLKKHNWFVCLFSKKKREERKQWEKRWGKHLTEAQEIEIEPMKYEPHESFYLDYTYKNTENDVNKNKWITDRRPTIDDVPPSCDVVFDSQGRVVFSGLLADGEPWMPITPPEPYVKPKRFSVWSDSRWPDLLRVVDDLSTHTLATVPVRDINSEKAKDQANDVAKQIAAIYEEYMLGIQTGIANDDLTAMSETKHTPGPWIGAGPSFGDPLPRYTTEIVTEWEDEDDQRPVICTLPFRHYDHENEANARLIAAAPELLEALEKALDALGGNDPHDLGYDDSICGYIRAAIAKAKGEQPSLSERIRSGCEAASWVSDEVQNLEATNAELCEEVQNFEAMKAELLEALGKALSMFDKMTDISGPYKYIDGTQLVSDSYDISNLLKQAIAKAKGEQP